MSLPPYSSDHPTRAAVEVLPGGVIIEFRVDWCPHCHRAAGPVTAVLGAAGVAGVAGVAGDASDVTAVAPLSDKLHYFRLEDERARPLGRSFKVKLWPTLLFLQDGVEVARVVRPTTADEVTAGLEQLVSNKEARP